MKRLLFSTMLMLGLASCIKVSVNESSEEQEKMNTNTTIENLITRRSIRSYKSEMPSKDVIEEICKVGTFAPTGMNRQSPIIIAVTDKATRDKLSRLNAAVYNSDSDPFYGAPVVLVVLADSSIPTWMEDGSLVMGNLMNAAHAKGLGSCWIHRAKEVFETEEGKAILAELGIQGDYVGIGNCILGYVDGDYPTARPRKDNYVFWIE